MKFRTRVTFSLWPLTFALVLCQAGIFYLALNTGIGAKLGLSELLESNPPLKEIMVYMAISTFVSLGVLVVFVRFGVEKLVVKNFIQLKQYIDSIGDLNTHHLDLPEIKHDEFKSLATSLQSMRRNFDINQKSMQQLAYYDKLTGLPNRSALNHELKILISTAERREQHFAVIFIDLDDFKEINDSLGHKIGDQLLAEVSQRIQHLLRGSDFIVREDLKNPDSGKSILARLAGDEFTLLISDIEKPSVVSKVAQRLLEGISKPFAIDQHEVQVGISMGIAIFPQDGKDADTLLKNADFAMFEAKNGGKNNFEFYTKEMNALAFQRLTMEKNIRRALDNQEFSLYFHPRINLKTEEVAGFEALLRWQNPDMGLVLPNQFLPLAEETILICEIGYWVFDNVCRNLKNWIEDGYSDVRVSINLSTMQIYRGDTYNMLKTVMSMYGIPGSLIEIEITEASLHKDEKAAIEFLNKLRELDIYIALDDFGTDNTSIRYLQNLPIDVLKLDRSFFIDIEDNPTDKHLIKSLVEIAHNLELATVASGLEEQAQIDFVRSIHCDYVQGYYYAKPFPGDEALSFLRSRVLA